MVRQVIAHDKRDPANLLSDGPPATEIGARELREFDLHPCRTLASRLLHAVGKIERELYYVWIILCFPLCCVSCSATRGLFVRACRFGGPSRFIASHSNVRWQQNIRVHLFLN